MRALATIPLLLFARLAVAQTATVTLYGVAYDSLRGAPLEGAFVALSGGSRSALSDARGLFHFDSVAPGTYTLTMQHDALDSIGVSGAARRVVVSDGRDTVRVSVPSFATLWGASCGAAPPPKDSGFVFGTVRGPAGVTAGATIVATWIEVSYDKQKGVNQRRWSNEVSTDARGGYAVCGTPTDVGVRLRASTDSSASGLIDLAPRELRVQRQDLMLGGLADADTTRRGTIVGVVTGTGARPVSGASVVTDGLAEVRTSADGRFVLRNVPAGTRQIEARSIGLQPVTAVVDVVARDTVSVAIELVKVVTLAPVRVEASTIRRVTARDFQDRRKLALGQFRDSTEFGRLPTMSGAFDAMRGVTVQRIRGSYFNVLLGGAAKCSANIFIDRVRMDAFDLSMLHPADIAAIEVYQPNFTPVEFMTVNTRRQPGCGAVVIWTKRAFP